MQRLLSGTKLSAAIGCSAVLFACAHTTSTGSTQTSGAPTERATGLCAMQVPGSTVVARDVEGGTALDFTTPSDRVALVRRKVRSMAAVYNHHASGEPIEGTPAAHAQPPDVDVHPDTALPPADASVEEIEDGMRLVLRPENPSDLARLRERARWRTGQCESAPSSGT